MYDSPAQMEPLLVSEGRPAYQPLIATADGFKQYEGLPTQNQILAESCKRSLEIEDIEISDSDVEHVLAGHPPKTDSQHFATAHITTEREFWNAQINPESLPKILVGIHRVFYESLPKSLRLGIQPGCLREREVKVGIHIPPKSNRLANFIDRYSQVYGRVIQNAGQSPFHRANAILASFAAHHRLVWIHPFEDGNGRVSRIILDMMLRACLGRPVHSMSSYYGLTRTDYYLQLSKADELRRGDLDGRGNLSASGLESFIKYSLNITPPALQGERSRL